MFTIFKSDLKKNIVAGTVSMAENDSGVVWKLRVRGNQEIAVTEDPKAFEGAGGTVMELKSDFADRQFSYLRGEFVIEPDDCDGLMEFSVDLDLQKAPGVLLVV